MKLLIEIPEEVMETKQYTRYFGACSGKLIETLENGIEFTGRPKGQWLDEKFVAFHLTCNRCGCNIRREKTEVFEGNYNYNYCPNCGAYMKGAEE